METVFRLTAFQRIFYRLVTPLLLGGGVFAAVAFTFFNLLRNSDAPAWMQHPLFRIGVAAFILGYMGWLSSRVAQVSLWVRFDGTSLHLKSLWTGRVRVRAIADIRSAGVVQGGLIGPWIEFNDGQRWRLEGRPGPGIRAIERATAQRASRVTLN